MFFKVGVRNFAIFTGIKTRLESLIYFPGNIAKFSRTAIFIEHLSKNLKAVHYFYKNSMKNVWQGPNQLIFPCLKSTIETLEKDVKYVQSQQYKHQNDVI